MSDTKLFWYKYRHNWSSRRDEWSYKFYMARNKPDMELIMDELMENYRDIFGYRGVDVEEVEPQNVPESTIELMRQKTIKNIEYYVEIHDKLQELR